MSLIRQKMAFNFSIEELTMIAIILYEDDTNKKKYNKYRMWVYPSLLTRKEEGEYYTLQYNILFSSLSHSC